jgi:hypothetical protein
MITLKEWLELVDYKITEGSEYYTDYGDDVYLLCSWNGKHDDGGFSSNIAFSTKTQEVFEICVHDYQRNRAYRLINSDYQDVNTDNTAWDGVDYIDLDVDDDFMQKHIAIFEGEDYDTRVVMSLDLPEDLINKLMRMAHEEDITFNQLIEKILKEYIDSNAN